MDRTPAEVRFSGGGGDLGRVALQLTFVTGHAGLGAGSLMMLERLPNPSPARARPQILDQGFSRAISPRGTCGGVWRHSGLSQPGYHTRDDDTTEDFPNYPAPESVGLRLGNPGLDD